MKSLYRKIRSIKSNYIDQYLVRGKTKIFCIGRNKTGTTSLKKAFEDLGFIVGNQRKAELMLNHYKVGNFEPIISYCKTAQVFQDFPFSFPETFKYVDREFPKSKFILSIRDSSEWYESVTKFHAKLFGKGRIPTAEDLKNAEYVWGGWTWECNRILYNSPENDPYNKGILIAHYEKYNNEVVEYFRKRPDDLLVINLKEKGSYRKLKDFLGINSPFVDFPWMNKTENIPIRK